MINLDFADVCTIMRDKGVAHMGIGRGKGEGRTSDAVKQAVSSPMLETSIEGARSVILNIMGSPDMTLAEVNQAANLVKEVVNADAMIIFGADVRNTLNDEILVTIIATGFDTPNNENIVVRKGGEQSATQSRVGIFGDNMFSPAQVKSQQTQEAPAKSTEMPQPKPQIRTRVQVDDDFPEFLKRMSDKDNK